VVALAAVFVPVRLDMSGLSSQMSKGLNDAARGASGSAKTAGETHGRTFGRAFGAAGGAELERSTGTMSSRVGGAMSGLTGRFASFGGIAVRGIGLAAGAMGGLAIAGAAMGVKTAASMEQAQIGFETLLGSGAKAQAFLTDLQTFAAQTPFELPGLIDSSRLLLGVGVSAKDTMGILQAFGNASSAVGVGQENFQRIMLATSQAIGAGRFMTEDLNQITENGIPIWTVLSRAMHKPVPELRNLASHGKLLSNEVLPILEKQMNKDYGGAMIRQSRSLSGVWSTFMDTLNIGLANVIRPLIPAMTVGLTGATNILSAALGAIPRVFSGAAGAGSAFSGVIRSLGGWIRTDLIPAFQAVYARVLPAARAAMASVASAFHDHQDVIQAVGQVFQGLGWVLTRIVIPALGLLYVATAATIGPMVRILLTAAGAVTTVVRAVVTWAPRIASAIGGAFATAHQAVSNFVTTITSGVTGAVTGAARALSGFGAVVGGAVVGAFRGAANWLVGVGGAIVNGLITGWNTIFPHLVIAAGHTRDGIMIAFRAVPTWLLGVGRTILQGLINGFLSMFGPFGAIVAGFIARHIIAPFARAVSAWFPAGRNFVTGLIRGVASMVGAVASTVANFISQRLIAPYIRAGVWLYVHARNYITGFINGARALFAAVSSTVAGFISQRLVGPFRSSIGWLVSHGRNIIQGLLNGAITVARTIAGWIQSHVINPITSTASRAWNALFNIGYNLLNALKNGIGSAIRGIRDWVNAHIVQPVIKAVRDFFGIGSPSKVMFEIGGHLISGLIQGLITSNPTQMIGKIFGGMPSALGSIVNKGLIAITKLPGKALSALGSVASKIGGIVGGLFSGGGGGTTYGKGVSQWSTVVLQALAMLGQPASWLGTVLNRMQRESGGNPRIVNTTDVNAMRGTPSVGLMQVIGPTYAANAGPFRNTGPFLFGTSTNPLANVYAGLHYALGRYGSLAALSRPGGYDAGGWLPPGGVGMNLTGRPERVLDPQASAAYASGRRGGGDVTVHVYFDGTLVDDRVRVVVEDGFDTFGAMLDNT
jgi:tape measure domain-containing protein